MDKLRGEINWSEEIREFIKRRIEEERKRKALERFIGIVKTLPEAPRGAAKNLVRGDRDSH
ncbi:type II toxin-antitoxin system VapB family antitoxin [Thermococcus chitonophagus]